VWERWARGGCRVSVCVLGLHWWKGSKGQRAGEAALAPQVGWSESQDVLKQCWRCSGDQKQNSPSDPHSPFFNTRFLAEPLDLLMKSMLLRPDWPVSRLPLLFTMLWYFGRKMQAVTQHQCGKASPWPTRGSSCPVLNVELLLQSCWTRQFPADLCSSVIAKCWEEWLGQEQVQQQAFTPVSLLSPNYLILITSHQLKSKKTFQDCQPPSLLLLSPLTDLWGWSPAPVIPRGTGWCWWRWLWQRCSPSVPPFSSQLCPLLGLVPVLLGQSVSGSVAEIVTGMQLYRKINLIGSSVIILWGGVSICNMSL